MKNIIFYCNSILILSLCYSKKSNAQPVYTIPWAVQQPQWVFPIWFEDATGAKDTIYFGIDSFSIGAPGSEADSIMGSYKMRIDTSEFHVYMVFGGLDSCKVRLGPYGIGGDIHSTRHVQYPLVLRWDNSLLFTEPIPSWNFDNSARLESSYIFFNYPPPVNPPYNSLHLKDIDTLYLPGETISGMDTNFPLNVYLFPLFSSSIHSKKTSSKFKILNNPSSDVVKIVGDEIFNFELYNSKMELIQIDNELADSKVVSIENLPQGIYFIFIHTSKSSYYEKIVKN
jgi:hypothetical protein